MLTGSPTPLTFLFSAMSAHLAEDAEGLRLVLADVVSSDEAGDVTCAAVITAGEYLRGAADARSLPPAKMVDLLRCAHQAMTRQAAQSCEGLVLDGVYAYLADSGRLWSPAQGLVVTSDPYRVVSAAVTVAVAALVWHANDRGVAAQDVARRGCLELALRQCDAPR